jgi:hypothetical protein
MSFFTTSISSVAATGATPPAAPGGRAQRTQSAAAGAESVTVDTLPASPPPEVLDAMGAASRAYDRLAAAGQHLRFEIDPPTGKVTVSLTDRSGNVLGSVAPSTALAVASGESPS